MAKATFHPADGSPPREISYNARAGDQAAATLFHATHMHPGYARPEHYRYCTICLDRCEPMPTHRLHIHNKDRRLLFQRRWNLCPTCLNMLLDAVGSLHKAKHYVKLLDSWCKCRLSMRKQMRLGGLERTLASHKTRSPGVQSPTACQTPPFRGKGKTSSQGTRSTHAALAVDHGTATSPCLMAVAG